MRWPQVFTRSYWSGWVPSSKERQGATIDELSEGMARRSTYVGSPREALAFAPMWQGVAKLSGDIASLPLILTDETKDPEQGALPEHNLYYRLRYKPRQGISAMRFWRRMVVQALLWNNAYAYIFRDGNYQMTSLYELDSKDVYWDPITQQYEIDAPNTPVGYRRVGASQVLHLEGIAFPDDSERIVMWQQAARSLGLGLETEAFASSFFANGATMRGFWKVPEEVKPSTRERLEKQLQDKLRAGKRPVIPQGVSWQPAQVTPVDAETSKLREAQALDAARWLNMPPEQLGLSANVSYSSLVEQTKSYLRQTLGPWLHTIQTECWDKLLSTSEQKSESIFMVHDIEPLFKFDDDRAEATGDQPRPATTTEETVTPVMNGNGNGRIPEPTAN